jgi:predicted alpha/beta superfamily hydrolase
LATTSQDLDDVPNPDKATPHREYRIVYVLDEASFDCAAELLARSVEQRRPTARR